jgi:AraC family transcriptional regulator of adaptative response/methylated-DNA-[protein]-cysteine methyltransferase
MLAGMNDRAGHRFTRVDAGSTRNYERVARAIEFLRRNATAQPDLAAIARHVHLSEHHFQRLFTHWAGISPKRFLQYLTVEHAKSRLVRAPGVLEAAGDVGLSGPGRMHELFVTLEAVSPGEYRAGGAGLEIRYGIHPSPFGPALVATTHRGICGLHFQDGNTDALALLRRDWPRAAFRRDADGMSALAGRLFGPLASAHNKPLALLVRGSNFQVKVWRALLDLPFGTVATYRDLAERIGAPGAARAVGSAIGANPIGWLIPCHRVIRASGELSRYRWGAVRKAAMLGWEAAHCAP